MKKVPYGIIDYKELITEGYEYVDKTMFLEELEDVAKTTMCLRPGRFGKSLFTSMLSYYYDTNSKDLFATLFKDTYVYEHPTINKNNYYILKFDFSGIDANKKTDNELKEEFNNKVVAGIKRFNNKYGYHYVCNEEKGPNGILIDFLNFIDSLSLNHKLYVMIDEYDNFTNAILEGDAKDFLGVVGDAGFVKSFYATIKEYIGLGIIDRFFATGICPITLDSMTTGFNICTDISLDPRFNEMIGLTHEEVKRLISDFDEKEKIYDLMIDNYDGYLFSKEAEKRVFNATLVMYFLERLVSFNKIPEELFDKNIVVNYGKIDRLLKLQQNSYYEGIIDTLLKTEKITGELKKQFNLKENLNKDDIISLLYYFGYLTIKDFNIITSKINFKIPNRVMKETYNRYFIKLLKDVNVGLDNDDYQSEYEEILYEGKIEKLTNKVSELLKKIDNRMFMKFDEKYVQLLYFTLLMGNKLISTYSEYPCSQGYIDLLLLKTSEFAKYNIMIELKYIKKSEYSEDLLEEKKREAIEQLKMYALDERLDRTSLKKYAVVFVGDTCKILEEVS